MLNVLTVYICPLQISKLFYWLASANKVIITIIIIIISERTGGPQLAGASFYSNGRQQREAKNLIFTVLD